MVYTLGMDATIQDTDGELMTERVHLVLSPSMLAAMRRAQHAAELPSLNDWIRTAIRAALEREAR